MSNWLVIGPTSFTGGHFVDYLESRKQDIRGATLRNWENLETLIARRPDYIVNFAAINVVAQSWLYPEKYMDVNVFRFSSLLELMRHDPPKRYIHISTPEIYGNVTGRIRESQPFNPSTPYAVSRAAQEMLLECYRKQYGFPVVYTRGCNVYGPGQQLYRLIPKVIACIKRGVKFPLEGGGHSVRSFLHVSDVCRAIYDVAVKGEVGEAYHLSSPLSWSIAGLVETICGMMGINPKDVVEIIQDRPGKDTAYLLDDTKLRRLGWNDNVSMDDGLREVIAWMTDNWDKLKDKSMEYSL